jgi:AcrR family transcriptional regulator
MPPTTKNSRQGRARQSREETRDRIVAAATELVRVRSYQELSVGEIMQRAGFERTIFYRHFDDLGDLLLRAGREAIEGLYEAELDLSAAREGSTQDVVRAAMEPAVTVYHRHGPLLRALAEAAAAGDERIAAGQGGMHRRFDELVVSSLRHFPQFARTSPTDLRELARALNVMNVAYLLDAFGHESRISTETALATVTEIWTAVINNPRPDSEAD